MSYNRVVTNLRIDNQHADGMLTKFGIGKDWEANEPRDEAVVFTPDLAGQYGWHYQQQFEYLKALNGIAPIGQATWADMDVADWTPSASNQWRNSSSGGFLRKRHLHFYDGAVGAAGTITKLESMAPNLLLSLWRFAGAAEETGSPLFGIVVKGTGADYYLRFPAGNDTIAAGEPNAGGVHTQPTLWGKRTGETDWAQIDTWDAGAAPKPNIGAQPLQQYIRIECLDDTILVRMTGAEDTWAFCGEWTSADGITVPVTRLVDGAPTLAAAYHTVMANVQELAYPAEADLYPRTFLKASAILNLTPTYSVIHTAETGTDIDVAIDTRDPYSKRPVVTFTATDTSRRAILYNVQEARAATVGGAVSSPTDTDTSLTTQVMEARGSVNSNWRGHDLSVTLRAAPGQSLAFPEPNAKLAFSVSCEDPDSYSGNESDYVRMFTGYADGPEVHKDAQLHPRSEATITGSCLLEARLAKKPLLWHSSYENWIISAAFEHILNRAGVPASLIDVDGFTGRLPSSTRKGLRKLQFSPDADYVSALDTIAESVNLRWGVGTDGIVRLWEPISYGGTPDFTLDEDTTNLDQVAKSISVSRSVEGFANLVLVLVGEGSDAQSKLLMDVDSIWTDGTRNFLGDYWGAFHRIPDGDYNQVDAITEQYRDERNRQAITATWDMWDMPELMPDDYVKFAVSGLGPLLTDAVFRIVRKSWSCNGQTGAYSQTLDAVLVAWGT